MKRTAPALEPNPIWLELARREEVAAASLFRSLCQSSPSLWHWLTTKFARDANARETFSQALQDEIAGRAWDETITDREAWQMEQRRLQEMFPAAKRGYGGLTRTEVEQLVRHYQAAGTVDLGAFLLAKKWRQKRAGERPSPTLLQATSLFLELVVTGNESLLTDFSKALRHLDAFEAKSKRSSAVGYQDWWKLNLALYILQHPRNAYRTRDLSAHLKSIGIEVGLRYIQRFCTLHGIARETTAGRPRRRRAKT